MPGVKSWLTDQSPYLWQDAETGYLVAVIGTDGSLWFEPVGDTYVPKYGAKATLVQNTTEATLTLTQPTGYVYVFKDFSYPFPVGGTIWKQVEPGGQVTTAMGYNSVGAVTEFQRSATVASTTTTESFLYGFDGNDRITSVLLRRQSNGGAWNNVKQALYTYHDGTDSFGLEGDLKLVQTQMPSGSGWATIDTTYYRYYVSYDISPPGFPHGLKYVINPASYQMMTGLGIDPTTASDATLSLYADFYYEYDPYGQGVGKEIVYRGSQTYSYSYESSGDPLIEGLINDWYVCTVEYRPDGTRMTVYSNYLGEPLIKDFSSDHDHWIQSFQYGPDAQVILEGSPSLVTGYSRGTDPDPVWKLNIHFQSLSGLAQRKLYYGSPGTDTAPTGYLDREFVSEGYPGGTTNNLKLYTYSAVTGFPYPAGGQKTYLVATDSISKDGGLTNLITTSYSYTFYPGIAQIQLMTVTLPVISTAQNGSGVAATRQVYYDNWGRETWLMDERGFITNKSYDMGTGALIQQIDDVDTSITSGAPSGWTTPSGGGLNLITDIQVDGLGRTTQILGPSHTIDIGGVATVVRRATWFVYQDATYQTWSAQGYATGTGPAYTYEMFNPVSITITDAEGRLLQEISATRGSGTTSSGALSPTDTYPQSSYVRWKVIQYLDCCFEASEQIYKLIPASGAGVPGTNYDETDFGYDVMKRRYRTVTPGGTITDLVFDPRGLVIGVYVGTDDTGATPTDPTGGGAAGNNMVIVTGNVFDGGSDGGDGNLTQETQWVDATTSRVTTMTYDFRNRQLSTNSPIDYSETLTYDNRDQITMIQRHDTTVAMHLISQSAMLYDDQGRVYQSVVYAVDPATGDVGNSLTDNFWFDASSNQIKAFLAGSSLFAKTTFDGLGRATVRYVGYGADSSYTDAFTVSSNTVMRQDETIYDAASNAIQITVRERYHNAAASQTGALTDPSGTPAARVSYFATYPDPLGRVANAANYGTNAGSALIRPITVPTPSDTILVDSTQYDATGNVAQTIDSAAMAVAYEYDSRDRLIEVINNYGGTSVTSSCTSSDDTDQTVLYSYTPDNQLATQVAVNSRTGNQTTTYTYGTTLSDSNIATSNLLRYVDYPMSIGGPGGSDSVALTWNRQRERSTLTDQRGCVHSYIFDLLGRLTNDCVTTLGTDVDGTVRQLTVKYEVRGMISGLTSYASATPNSGTIVNDVQLEYNSFSQVVSDSQSHSGAVVPGTTPMVQYAYADGSTNTIRPQTLTYPNGRMVTTGYGTSGGINDSCSRVDNLTDPSGTLVNYSYLGLRTAVQITYPQPGIQYTLLGSSSGTSPAGDIYWGLDLFGRVIDSRWFNVSTNADVDRTQYGYNRASSLIWRQNPVATAAGAQFDEFYINDGLKRLKQMQRGTLNSTYTGITSPTFGQCWTLEPTGNWMGFNEAASGSSWTTVQTRTANAMNEITNVTNTVGGSFAIPAYDAAGNMTTMPQPASPGDSYTATYDAWNRQMTVSDGGALVQSNQYDARTFRTVRVTPSVSEARHFYYSSNWRDIEERVSSSTTADRQFVWGGRYIDDLILRDSSTGRLYSLQDRNWNVTSITDTFGAVQERYAYQSYGSPTFMDSVFAVISESAYEWEHLYCAYYCDSVTYLHIVRMRFYHSLLGFWCQPDSLAYRADVSLYQYVTGQPLVVTDPKGMNPTPPYNPFVGPRQDVAYTPEFISFYIGHNTEVAEMFNQDNWDHVWCAAPIPDGKCIGGLCCGFENETPEEDDDSFQNWMVKYHPENAIPNMPDIDNDLFWADLPINIVSAMKAIRAKAQEFCKKARKSGCSAMRLKVRINVKCSEQTIRCLATGKCPNDKGEIVQIAFNEVNKGQLALARNICTNINKDPHVQCD